MIVTGKSIGRRKPLFDDWSIPLEPMDDGEGGRTLRNLIATIVRTEVARFQKRQHDRQFLRVLTPAEIDEGAAAGKIEMGASEVPVQDVDPDDAIATAWQAFEDGVYLVAIDEQQYTDLDQQVFLSDESRITFIRLTFLSGG